MKKAFFFILAVALIGMQLFAGGGRDSSAGTSTGVPTIRIATRLHSMEAAADWSKPFGQYVLERTGVHVIGEYWPDLAVTERQNLLLASGNLPDLMYVTRDQAFLYGDEGLFEPLDDLLARNAPNFMRQLTPANSVILRSPYDGKIYNMPTYDDYGGPLSGPNAPLTYRRDIIEEMGEPEPDTMQGWYDLFKRVQARYPDMIVLSDRDRNVFGFIHTIFDMGRIDGNFGVIGREFDRREIKYLPITNEWRDMLTFYVRLYSEGLLDPEFLTIQYNDWWERKIGAGRAFACFTMNASRCDQANDLALNAGLPHVKWRTMVPPRNYYTGERGQMVPDYSWDNAGFALNARSTVKDAAIRYVDFFYGSEYPEIRRGFSTNPRFPQRGTLNEWDWHNLLGIDGFYYHPWVWPNPDSTTPGNTPAVQEFHERNARYKIIIPMVARSGDLQRYTSLVTELNTYMNTTQDEFITGRRPLSQWDAYVAQLRRLGVDEATAMVQGWYDNYWRQIGQ